MSEISGQMDMQADLKPNANATPGVKKPANADALLGDNESDDVSESANGFNELLLNHWLLGQSGLPQATSDPLALTGGNSLPPGMLPMSLPGMPGQANPFADLNALLTKQNAQSFAAPVEGVVNIKMTSQQPVNGLDGKMAFLDAANLTAKFDENGLLANQPAKLMLQSQLSAQTDTLLNQNQAAQTGAAGQQGVSGQTPGFSLSQSVSTYSSQAHLPPITSHLDQQQGMQQLTDRINWMIGANMQKADMRLDPPDLGSLDVRVSVTKDQANVSFNVSNAQAKEAIEAAIPRLREMFSEAGVNLGHVDVSQHSFSEHAQSDADQHAANGINTTNEADEVQDQEQVPALMMTTSANGLLDVFA